MKIYDKYIHLFIEKNIIKFLFWWKFADNFNKISKK